MTCTALVRSDQEDAADALTWPRTVQVEDVDVDALVVTPHVVLRLVAAVDRVLHATGAAVAVLARSDQLEALPALIDWRTAQLLPALVLVLVRTAHVLATGSMTSCRTDQVDEVGLMT